MDIITQLKIKLFYKEVGVDEFGNRYFRSKNDKRFVLYNGLAEPSKIPAEWHGWIHYTTNKAPININTNKYSWQKIHTPNLTGTKNSYSPNNSKEKKTSAGYSAWHPKEN